MNAPIRPEQRTDERAPEGSPPHHGDAAPAVRGGIADVAHVLRDPRFAWSVRLLRLQGWRGQELARACAAGKAARLAPAVCALGGWLVVITGSVPLALLVAATALIGMFSDNHPVEMLHNVRARSLGRAEIPVNRAAKRLGCALGAAFLLGASVSFVSDTTTLGRGLALAMAVVASFVAATNLCLPSMLFTLVSGSERASERDLI